METLRQRIRSLLEEGPTDADTVARQFGVARSVASSALASMMADGELTNSGRYGSKQYAFVSTPRAPLSEEARRRMSHSARERRFREMPRSRTAPGSGVITPPPYARGYRWGSGLA